MIKHVLQLKLQTGNKTKFQVAVMKKIAFYPCSMKIAFHKHNFFPYWTKMILKFLCLNRLKTLGPISIKLKAPILKKKHFTPHSKYCHINNVNLAYTKS